MFLTFTPNPCLERTLRVPTFARGASHRVAPQDVVVSAGGKGFNASRVAVRFGLASHALAPVGRFEALLVRDLLEHDGIGAEIVEVETATRTCMALVHGGGELTEVLEAGNPLAIGDGTALLEAWRTLLSTCDLAYIGGSYPPSPSDGWKHHPGLLCSLAAKAGKPIIYDGKGEGWRRAVFSKTPPWCIKPNLDEMRELWKRPIENAAEERRAVRDLLRRGLTVVLLSCGSRGLYVGYRDQIEFFEAPRIEAVSAVGSGDSLVGAFAAIWRQTGDVWEAARWGVAAGSANAAQFEAAHVGPPEVEPLVPSVRQHTAEIRLSVG